MLGKRRENAKYAFTVYNGIVRQVYVIHGWAPVTARSLQQKTRQRWRFDGEIAEELQHYVGGSVEDYISHGEQNPIKYINC